MATSPFERLTGTLPLPPWSLKSLPGVTLKISWQKVWSEVAQLCQTLCDPMDGSLPGSIHGIFQARILEWVAISFSIGSSWPRDRTWVSHIAGRCFTVWATRKVNPYCWLFMHVTPPGTSYLLGWWQKLWFSLFNIKVFPFSFISLGIWIFLIWCQAHRRLLFPSSL